MNTFLLFIILPALISCGEQEHKASKSNADKAINAIIGDTVSAIGENIGCIFQDKDDVYWFASNGDGVYRYDGKSLIRFADKHGLCSNFVWTIQEDVKGNLWFTTRDCVCRFDGKTFTDFTGIIRNTLYGMLHYQKGGIFFGHPDGVCYFDGKAFTNFTIHPYSYKPEPYSMSRPYDVYSTLVDRSGNVWFGTQEMGVCCYDGKSFTWFTEKGLSDAAVRCIFQDKAGNIWMGNNGSGLFRYDGKTLTNFTDQNNLGNPDFLRERKVIDKPGTLARVWSVNEDIEGNLWIGTIDAGAWKYDGNRLTNYTTKDGLAGNAIWTIYKDKKSELWFVADGEILCKFNGKSFTKVVLDGE